MFLSSSRFRLLSCCSRRLASEPDLQWCLPVHPPRNLTVGTVGISSRAPGSLPVASHSTVLHRACGPTPVFSCQTSLDPSPSVQKYSSPSCSLSGHTRPGKLRFQAFIRTAKSGALRSLTTSFIAQQVPCTRLLSVHNLKCQAGGGAALQMLIEVCQERWPPSSLHSSPPR